MNLQQQRRLRERLCDLNDIEILSGPEGIQAVATIQEADQVLDGMGGSAGLLPTLCCHQCW